MIPGSRSALWKAAAPRRKQTLKQGGTVHGSHTRQTKARKFQDKAPAPQQTVSQVSKNWNPGACIAFPFASADTRAPSALCPALTGDRLPRPD